MWTIRRDVPISATHRGIASVPNSARDKLKDSAHAKAVVAEMQDAMTKLDAGRNRQQCDVSVTVSAVPTTAHLN